jgi:hypothetical protein
MSLAAGLLAWFVLRPMRRRYLAVHGDLPPLKP